MLPPLDRNFGLREKKNVVFPYPFRIFRELNRENTVSPACPGTSEITEEKAWIPCCNGIFGAQQKKNWISPASESSGSAEKNHMNFPTPACRELRGSLEEKCEFPRFACQVFSRGSDRGEKHQFQCPLDRNHTRGSYGEKAYSFIPLAHSGLPGGSKQTNNKGLQQRHSAIN